MTIFEIDNDISYATLFQDEHGNVFAAVVDSEAYDYYIKAGYAKRPLYTKD
jgi:hypothetical protein